MKTTTVFFGTEQFASEILQSLIDSDSFDIQMVVTQPDRPVGRKQEIEKSPVKLVAEKYNFPIKQPSSKTSLTNLQSEIINLKLNIVCQYGLIIPKEVLEAPELGSINVHPSLLPKYRGASPIQSAIINGETKTGVSIMLMDAKMDHGDILAQQEVNIDPDDTFEVLHNKLLEISKPLLVETLKKYLKNKTKPQVQNDNVATFCKIFTRADGQVNWKKSAQEIYNLYRGLTPWPGIWTTAEGIRLKLLKIAPTNSNGVPGQIIADKNQLLVGCGKNAIEILELQPEGKKSMTGIAFKNGHKDIIKLI